MSRAHDLTNRRFGRFAVKSRAATYNGRARWVCLCDCGNTKEVLTSSLLRGTSNSCGCLRREVTSARRLRHGLAKNRTRPSEYNTWVNIKERCGNPKVPHYFRYGGRGISVCNRWLESFDNFFADMGPKPSPKHSIERIDNNGNYEPKNCKWATSAEQRANTRAAEKYQLTWKQ